MILPVVVACHGQGEAEHAERLLWSGQYLVDINQVRADLVKPAEQIRAARQSP